MKVITNDDGGEYTLETMGRKSNLNEAEKKCIDFLANKNYSSREIGAALNRGKSSIAYYLANKGVVRTVKPRGRPRKLSNRLTRLVVRKGMGGKKTARDVLEEVGLNVSLRTIQRTLSRSEHLVFGPLMKRPRLTDQHKKRRFMWSKQHDFVPSGRWKRTIFTDEKRFCLDGPDGESKFWGDRRLPRDIFSKRPRGGGGVMVWGGISWRARPL